MSFYNKIFMSRPRVLYIVNFKDKFLSYNPLFFNIYHFSSSTPNKNDKESVSKKKKKIVPRITLHLPDNKMSITTIEEAEKFAKRRNFILINTLQFDTKGQRPIYKLETKGQKTQKNEKKDEKVLSLSHKIGIHDLQTKIRNIEKWISKNAEVKVSISGELDKCEEVYKTIEKEVKNFGKIVQKRDKGNEIRFQILPPKKPKEEKEE